MAEAIISFVLESLGYMLIQEAEFLHGVKSQAEQLQDELRRMRWFLKDVDAKQDEGERVHDWVSQVRDLAYEAENLVETYAFKIASCKFGGFTGSIMKFACFLNERNLRHRLRSDMESLTIRISNLTKCFHDYGIRSIMENKMGSSIWRRPRQFRRTYSVVVDEDEYIVGLEADVNILVKILVSDNYRVASVCGMGGLGKTTLARKVYHHPRIRRHFEGFCWVCISQYWEKRDVLQGVLIKLASKKRELIEKWRDEELVRELYEILQNRRCLVVLDDIWSTDAWESIKDGFPIKSKGSKVLITTRNRAVATRVDSFIHEPQLLDNEESWELLRRRALPEKCCQGDQELEKIAELGKEMVAHCGGLPLAVVVLGGILSSKRSYSEWDDVCNNIKSYLRKGKSVGQDQGDIQKILALSYDDLPYQLKPCFLYLSKYREDEDIKAETLYQIWIAEGLVSIEDRIGDDETMMDIAERYLGELVERCLVFVEREEVTFFRRFKFCRLHDLMRDLCLLKAEEENFLELIDHQIRNDVVGDHSSSYRRSSYRLCLNLSNRYDVQRFVSPTKTVSRRLRSLSIVLRYQPELNKPVKLKLTFTDFCMLRVLLLEGLNPEVESDGIGWGGVLCVVIDNRFITSIGKLIHLRYLSLRKSTFFCIPSVRNLKQLQTLDLRDSDIRWISKTVGKLTRLKHLYLPEDFTGNLLLDGLIKLEILEGFNNRVCDAKHLSILKNLRSLKARVQENFKDLREFIHHVSKLTCLHLLSLEIQNCAFVSEEKLAMLKDVLCLSSLVHLSIIGKISTFPEFETKFSSNLHSLDIFWSEMEEDPLSMLEKLPNLRKLKLGSCSFVGKEMTCHATGFPQLRSLNLSDLRNLEKWEIEDGAMPNLSHLEIYECLQLQMIPDGIRFLRGVKKMNLVHMPEELCARVKVKDDGREGADFHKVRHISSIITIPI